MHSADFDEATPFLRAESLWSNIKGARTWHDIGNGNFCDVVIEARIIQCFVGSQLTHSIG